jgi:hypothetical protein
MRRPTRTIVPILAAALVALGLVRWTGGPSPARPPIRPVDAVAPPAPTPRAADARPAAPPPAAPRGAPDPAPAAPVFDLATLARRAASKPTVDRDRFRTTDRFTADDLAHPERYFDAAEHVPELRRDEERHDALAYFVAYRAKLARELRAAGRDTGKRADVRTIIGRYDAAIARLRASGPTTSP